MKDRIKLENTNLTDLQKIFDEIIDGASKGHFNPTYVVAEDGRENLQRMLIASMNGETVPVFKDVDSIEEFSTRLAKVTLNDEYVGFLLVYRNKDITELMMASIFPEYRGKGLGRELCKLFKKVYKKNQLLVRCKKASTIMRKVLINIGFKVEFVDEKENSYLYYNKKK